MFAGIVRVHTIHDQVCCIQMSVTLFLRSTFTGDSSLKLFLLVRLILRYLNISTTDNENNVFVIEVFKGLTIVNVDRTIP